MDIPELENDLPESFQEYLTGSLIRPVGNFEELNRSAAFADKSSALL